MIRKVKKPSVIPIYGIAAAALLYNLIFPMYRLTDMLICAAVCAASFFLLRLVFKGRTIEVEAEEPEPSSGNPALDEAMKKGKEILAETISLNERIPDESLTATLHSVEKLTAEIFRQVKEQPEKLPKIRTAMDYYLPTMLKLVRKYEELQNQREIPNVKKMLDEIEDMVSKVEQALHRQLDALYEHDVIDITADVRVMEQMLQSQGLLNDSDFKTSAR